MDNIKKLWEFMAENRKMYVISIIAMALSVVVSLINPIVIKITVDSIIGEKAVDSLFLNRFLGAAVGIEFLKTNLWIIGLVLVLLTVVRGLFLYIVGKYSATASEDAIKNLREMLYEHIQKLPFSYHKNADTGDLIQRATSDMDTIRRFLSVQLVESGKVLMMIVLSFMVMASMNLKLALIGVSMTPFIFSFAYFFFLRIQSVFQESDEAEAEMSTTIQENLSGVRVVRAFAAERMEIEKFDEKNRTYRDKTNHMMGYIALYWGGSDLLCFSQIGVVLIFGTIMTLAGEITLGTLVAFTTYITMLVWPVRQFGNILTDLGKALVSVERIMGIMKTEIEDYGEAGEKPEFKGKIVFKNVSFAYPDEPSRQVLKNIDLSINEGETVVILGRTGSGKSTLIHLLAGLYEVKEGSITIDGFDIKVVNKVWLRKNIGLILQEPFLYAKTVEGNIDLRKIKDLNQIRRVAKAASIDEDILSFEKGYDTYVGEKGVTLSGGQQQRIAIARTIIDEAPILIFDDSLSAVDSVTEKHIRRELARLHSNITTIIITHRISSALDADLIAVIENSRVVQSGTHKELIAQAGSYREMWKQQEEMESRLENEINEN
ncbi:MAG: ABC transporter ATP-binding protein [Eubacteriaceae bacterium]|nr:ABC transporter ATP-binding protein [Eubacteriaceae bacterium]